MLLKTDSWLGWTKCRQTCTKPLSPLKLRFGKDWRGSSEVSRGCGGLRGDLRPSPSWRCFPCQLIKDQTSTWKGSNLPTSSFGASSMQLLTTFSVTFVFSSGVLTMMTSLVTILLNFAMSTHKAGLMKQLFFSHL